MHCSSVKCTSVCVRVCVCEGAVKSLKEVHPFALLVLPLPSSISLFSFSPSCSHCPYLLSLSLPRCWCSCSWDRIQRPCHLSNSRRILIRSWKEKVQCGVGGGSLTRLSSPMAGNASSTSLQPPLPSTLPPFFFLFILITLKEQRECEAVKGREKHK